MEVSKRELEARWRTGEEKRKEVCGRRTGCTETAVRLKCLCVFHVGLVCVYGLLNSLIELM